MDKRINIILLVFILTLVVIIIGNYIHLFFIKKGINYENKDTYLKIDKNNLAILIEIDRNNFTL